MSIDNTTLIIILIGFQTLMMTLGFGVYLYRNKNTKPKEEINPVIEIEALGRDRTGFGYIAGKSLILNEKGMPYLYKTYNEAKRRMKRVRSAERIVHQAWDMETQTVLVSEVRHGAN